MQQMQFEAVQHGVFPFIEHVQAVTDDEKGLLDQIGALLRAHGKTDRFGMCLLHKHFDVAADEVLLEETDVDARTSVIRVHPANAVQGPTITTMWRFSGDAMAPGTECVMKCTYAGGHSRTHSRRAV